MGHHHSIGHQSPLRRNLWARDGQIVDEINQTHTNHRYLGDARSMPSWLPRQTSGRGESSRGGIDCRTSSHFREVLASALSDLPMGILISLSKGLEKGSRMRMTEIIHDVAPGRRACSQAPTSPARSWPARRRPACGA